MCVRVKKAYHDGEVFVVDAVVVDGGLEHVRVFGEPVGELGLRSGEAWTYHLGRLTGGPSILIGKYSVQDIVVLGCGMRLES